MPSRPTTSGFTLIEVFVALAIAATLLGIAISAWLSVTEAAHASTARASLLESLGRSVSHSALTGTEVILCPGDPAGCRDTYDWSSGWIAFADVDGDRRRDASETLVLEQPGLEGSVHLRSTTGRRRLVFQPNGGNVGSNVTFTICDGRGPEQARTLVLANHGRFRAAKPNKAAAVACGGDI